MPARSQAQRAYLNANFGHDWVKKHGFDNKGSLPAHAKPKRGGKARDQLVRQFMAGRKMEKTRGQKHR